MSQSFTLHHNLGLGHVDISAPDHIRGWLLLGVHEADEVSLLHGGTNASQHEVGALDDIFLALDLGQRILRHQEAWRKLALGFFLARDLEPSIKHKVLVAFIHNEVRRINWDRDPLEKDLGVDERIGIVGAAHMLLARPAYCLKSI